ncbi:hypothetical protein BFL35_12475 [Clavibacter michiganensis]|nr:hypothetical protein BFL35_12475 [Clavibacter michiganensis]
MEARRRGAGHLGEGGVDDVGCARQLDGAEGDGLRAHALELVLRGAAQHGGRALDGRGAHDDEVAQALEEVLDEAARILAGLDDAVHPRERGGGVMPGDRVDDLVEQGGVRVAEERDGALVLHALVLGSGDELVEQGEGVAHRPAAGPDHERQDAGGDAHVLLRREVLHVVEHLRGRHEAERVVVRAGADGADDLVGLGGGEDELHVLRRLLHDLQQRVEALRRDHVRLVEDEDLVAVARRREDRALADVARVVDAVVAGRVDLHHVERPAAVAAELDAARADAARGVRGALRAVEAAREDAGRRGLAAAARAAEEVRVVDAVGAEGGAQRIRHLRLADELGEVLWPITAIQGGDHEPEDTGHPRPSPRPGVNPRRGPRHARLGRSGGRAARGDARAPPRGRAARARAPRARWRRG